MSLFSFVKNLIPSYEEVKDIVFNNQKTENSTSAMINKVAPATTGKAMVFPIGAGMPKEVVTEPFATKKAVQQIQEARIADKKIVSTSPTSTYKTPVANNIAIAKTEAKPSLIQKAQANIQNKFEAENPYAVTNKTKAELEKEFQTGVKQIPDKATSFAKTILQAPQRTVTSIALEAPANILSMIQKRNVVAKYTPTSKFEKMIFGEEPITGMYGDQQSAEKDITPILVNKLGLDKDVARGMSIALSALFVGGLKALDITPIGGDAKAGEKIFSKIAASSNALEIAEDLVKFGIKDTGLAEKLVNVNNAKEVKDLVGFSLVDARGAGKLTTEEVPINQLKSIEGDREMAQADFAAGKISKTDLPVLVRKEADGSMTVLDGNGRIVQAEKSGQKTIKITSDEATYRKLTQDTKVIPKTVAEVKKNVDTIGDELNSKMVDQVFREDKLNLPQEMTDEVVKRLTALGMDKRTVRTFGEMSDAALELGTDPKTLLKDVSTNRITDAQVVALRNTINNNKQFISDAVERIKTNPEMEEVLTGQIDVASAQIDQALGKLVKGGTEAGRAVVAFRILAQNTLDPVFWMTKLKKVLNGGEVTGEMQRAIMDLTNRKDINGLANFVALNVKSTNSEKAVTLWKAGLLTSPTTHIANVTGNITMRLLMDASDVVALPMDVLASLITGKRTKIINLDTITAEVSGSVKGVKEAGRYMRTGAYSDQFLKKWDLPRQVNFENKILDGYTKGVFKSLGAEDIVFRQIAIEKAMSEQSQLIAKSEGLAGKEFKDRVKQLLVTPTNEMILNAIDAAEYATFQSKSAIGDAVVGAKRALAHNNSTAAKVGLVGLEIVAPFTKTPSNIISRIVDYSPVGFIKAIANAVKPATRSQKIIIDDLSRAVTGSSVMALGYLLAEQGLLSGGTPEDAKDRSTEYYKGQSSSILINGEWRELKRISPVGNILIMGADIYDMYQNQGKRGADLGSSIAFSGVKNLTEQSFLRGVSGALDALMSPDRSAEKFVKQTTASLVPSVVTRIAKSIDPTLRESDNIMEAFQERLPILREKLAPVRDIFGEVAKVPAGSNYWFDPFSSKQDKSNEPIIKELTTLKHPIGMPERIIDGVKMNSYEYSEYQRYNGKILKPTLEAIISSDEYKTLNSDEKKQIIDQTITTIRQGVNDTVFPALMMVRYNLDKDTDPLILRELIRQLDARPGYKNKSDDEKATIIKKFLYGMKDQLKE